MNRNLMNIDNERLERAALQEGRAAGSGPEEQGEPCAEDVAGFERALAGEEQNVKVKLEEKLKEKPESSPAEDGKRKSASGCEHARADDGRVKSRNLSATAGSRKPYGPPNDSEPVQDRPENEPEERKKSSEAELGEIFSGLMRNTLAALEKNAPLNTAGQLDFSDASAPENLEGLVRRILVATPEKGRNEIILSLDESVLPETEIRLTTDPDGGLSVTLSAGDPASFQILNAALENLQKRLEKYSREVKVNLRAAHAEGRAGDEPGSQSEYEPASMASGSQGGHNA